MYDLVTNTAMERVRFESNGNLLSYSADAASAQGTGGVTLFQQETALVDNRPSAVFINVEWVGNGAGNGAAVGLYSGVIDASFHRCLMRGNLAYMLSHLLFSCTYLCQNVPHPQPFGAGWRGGFFRRRTLIPTVDRA